MSEYVRLWEDGPFFAQSEHFKLGTDSVLLADFVKASSFKNGIDLGCGSGILPLLLLEKTEKLRMTGLEIQEAAADAAENNISKNGFNERCRIVTGDIKNCRAMFKSGEFDLVTANPPYFAEGSGKTPSDPARAAARGEILCTLEDICAAAAYLCRTGGAFFLVHRAERLSEVMTKLHAAQLEPKRLRLICSKSGAEPGLFLLESRRGGKPGLKIMPQLVLHNDDGSETDEILKIYHRKELL